LNRDIESLPLIVQTEKLKNGSLKPLSREQRDFNAQLEDELAFVYRIMEEENHATEENPVHFWDSVEKHALQNRWRSIKLNRKPNGMPLDPWDDAVYYPDAINAHETFCPSCCPSCDQKKASF
jgi:hypothetical protein